MNFLNIIAPLLTVLAVFIAYIGGKHAGKKSAELKQIKKEQGESTDADEIIDTNNMLDLHHIDMWLQDRAKK